MRRREFIAGVGGAGLAWPLAARAQQPERIRRIGVLVEYAENDPRSPARVAAFREGMERLGWVDGRNARFDWRWTAGDTGQARRHAAELVASSPDVILVSGRNALIVHQATRTVPIVFVNFVDPVGSKLVQSMPRPGGNITGFTLFDYPMIGKWFEILKELAPENSRILLLQSPENFSWQSWLGMANAVAPAFGVTLTPGEARNADEIRRVIVMHALQSHGAVVVLPDTTTSIQRDLIIKLTAQYRLPTVFPYRFFVSDGGLISYGIDVLDGWRKAATYVDRIVRGERPGELPVQAPTKFELVINLKTAKALGLTVPPMLLARADEVIE